jgi:hypothetical protein
MVAPEAHTVQNAAHFASDPLAIETGSHSPFDA